jgi:hypothetical protein
MIKAHGVTYTTVEQAREAIADLQAKNEAYGASDGRVTEINAIEAAIAEATPAVEQAPREHVVVDDEDGRWTVVKDSFESPCDHPMCALLHARFHEGTETRTEWVDLPNGGRTLVTVRGVHEKTNHQWLVLRNGQRVGNAWDTKREAIRDALDKPRY